MYANNWIGVERDLYRGDTASAGPSSIADRMKRFQALMSFDFSSCWKGQCVWWIFCLVQMGAGIGIRYDLSPLI